jgi:predicted nucleic acid-binding protein
LVSCQRAPALTGNVAKRRPRLEAGEGILLAASVYAAVMVRPLQRGAAKAVDDFIESVGGTIVVIDRCIARRAAGASHRRLRLPDALSLATAREASARLLTLDRRPNTIFAREMKRGRN